MRVHYNSAGEVGLARTQVLAEIYGTLFGIALRWIMLANELSCSLIFFILMIFVGAEGVGHYIMPVFRVHIYV
ncbi:hypothetical protein PSCICO_54220 [Pseudomonas cichorii]|nr:hypothetical protein PSCICO_54220 [Pseudomonas cichorii]